MSKQTLLLLSSWFGRFAAQIGESWQKQIVYSIGIEVLLWFIQFLYFYGSSVPRRHDEETHPFARAVFVHAYANFLLTCLLVSIHASSCLSFLCQLWICIQTADFLVGCFHFAGDVTRSYHFLYHHEDATFICQQSYSHHTIDSYYASFLFYTAWRIVLQTYPPWQLQLIVLLTIQGNETHIWAHCRPNQIGPVISFLQKYMLMIHASIHRQHHVPPYDKCFCTLTGFTNPLLNLLTIPLSRWVAKKQFFVDKPCPTKGNYEPER